MMFFFSGKGIKLNADLDFRGILKSYNMSLSLNMLNTWIDLQA